MNVHEDTTGRVLRIPQAEKKARPGARREQVLFPACLILPSGTADIHLLTIPWARTCTRLAHGVNSICRHDWASGAETIALVLAWLPVALFLGLWNPQHPTRGIFVDIHPHTAADPVEYYPACLLSIGTFFWQSLW